MVSKTILKAHGCSAEAWKKLLILPEPPEPKKGKRPQKPPPNKEPNEQEKLIDALRERIRLRLSNGREQTTKNFRTIRALDLIWDAPYRQVSPTLLWDIAENAKTKEEIEKQLTFYGFDLKSTMVTEKDPKTGEIISKLNAPLFFAVTIPLVRAMLDSRKAKLVNDRNRNPFWDFPPAVNTKKNRIRVSAAKSRMHLMAQQYNYLATLDQATHQMLLYSNALMFTQEAWHWEEQLRPKKKAKGDKKKDLYETYVTKEGLRYFLPHPARTFWDRSHPVRTFNTETGCDWGAHYTIKTYKDLFNNKEFYNTEKIDVGDLKWWSDNAAFLNVFFGTCVISAPTASAVVATDQQPDSRTQDREQWIESQTYTQSDLDKSVCLFEYRERLVPKDWGLGSYEHPIWARFVCAGDGTIVFAEPLCYRAIIAWKDNGDEKRMEDASMALKLSPFQDQLSQLVTQYILSVKQNLANITLIDTNVVSDKTARAKIKNLGEQWFRSLNIQEFDGKMMNRARENMSAGIYSHRFPQLDTNSILLAARTVIELAERVMNFSTHEVGQTASHEQTKAETIALQNTSSNMLKYTGIPVDGAMHAWGTQAYEAWVNYGEDEFTAEVPYDDLVTKKVLEELGFEFVEEPDDKEVVVHVRGKRSKVMPDLLSFALLPNSVDRQADVEVARVLADFTDRLLNGPIGPAIGPDQAIMLYNSIAKHAGLPLDTPLKNTGLTPEKQAEQARAQLSKLVDQVKTQFAQEVEGRVMGEVQQGLVPLLQAQKQTQMRVDALWSLLRLPPLDGTGNGTPGALDRTTGLAG